MYKNGLKFVFFTNGIHVLQHYKKHVLQRKLMLKTLVTFHERIFVDLPTFQLTLSYVVGISKLSFMWVIWKFGLEIYLTNLPGISWFIPILLIPQLEKKIPNFLCTVLCICRFKKKKKKKKKKTILKHLNNLDKDEISSFTLQGLENVNCISFRGLKSSPSSVLGMALNDIWWWDCSSGVV